MVRTSHVGARLVDKLPEATWKPPTIAHMDPYDPARRPESVMHPFAAMAEPVRRRIVDILASGEHTSGQVAEVIGHEFRISRTAVSKHLRILRDAGFVDVRADLAWRWYRLTPQAIRILEVAVAELREKWQGRVGWDADAGGEHDPLAQVLPRVGPAVRRRGPGRPLRRGKRGTQTDIETASEPDLGLYPVPPIPEPRLEG